MDFTKGVPFDPGYCEHTYIFSESLNAFEQFLSSHKKFSRKKSSFLLYRPKIVKLYENSTAFYLGCLLWATFIKLNFQNSPKEILDNAFLGKKIPDEDVFYEINAILGYFDKYSKDCLYYTGKSDAFSPEWKQILTIYREFLSVNENFEKVQYTSDLKLPDILKIPSEAELMLISEKIEAVVKSGKLEDLFEIKELIL